jgi:cob(I)alamin adenosyltransferase
VLGIGPERADANRRQRHHEHTSATLRAYDRMKIYTRRGDEGQTDLRDMTRVSKANPRIEAYGNVDEVNCLIGRARPTGHDDVDEWLTGVQNHLHIVQADFASPESDEDDPVIRAEHVERV